MVLRIKNYNNEITEIQATRVYMVDDAGPSIAQYLCCETADDKSTMLPMTEIKRWEVVI